MEVLLASGSRRESLAGYGVGGVHFQADDVTTKRTYYDHEAVYRRIAEHGGRGWDDRHPGEDPGGSETASALEGVESASFDAVVDNHLLHCLVDPSHRARCLASVMRVLRPGGTFFSETMSAEGDFEPSKVDADPVTRVSRSGARIWVTQQELDAELAEAGLGLVHRTPRPQDGTGDLMVSVCRKG